MHVGNIPRPGEPASHGCIRMPKDFVPTLFEMVKIGTPVKIGY
jgi:lipoprotein-anchoring transpeptidase ErfK/SrfK